MKNYNTLEEIRTDLKQGNITVEGLVDFHLNLIEEKRHLNAFLEVYTDDARKQAALVDKKLKDGTAGKLAGMVVSIKDNICYNGHSSSASSKILKGFESLYSSTVVERMLAEDAVIIGRTNCDEFAMGSSNENSAYGKVLNAQDEERVPGGSSGGAAVSVQANLCQAALGSDTGGSVRQPASFTGTVGVKPTYGRVSRHGLIAFASSLDQISPFTKSVEDAALLLEVICGQDEFDSTSAEENVPAFSENLHFSNTTSIAYLKDCIYGEGISDSVRDGLIELLESLEESGHTVSGEDFPYLDLVVPTYYVISTAEASSNLSRYAGMHYGYRSEEGNDLDELISHSRSEGFGAEVKRRIMLGTFVLSHGYYDAYYTKAQQVRRMITDYTKQMLEKHDFVMLPTTPTTAFKFGAKTDDPVAMYLSDIFTVQASLSGLPAVSLPLGKGDDGMPYGVQVIGKKFGEIELLAFSKYLMDKYAK